MSALVRTIFETVRINEGRLCVCRVGAQMLRKMSTRHPLSIGEKGQMELLLPWRALAPKFWPFFVSEATIFAPSTAIPFRSD